jgi:hypothetical protein
MVRRSALGVMVCLGLALLAGMLGASCGAKQEALSGTCTINSDCDPPLVCAFGRCHSACAETRDCPPGETCLVSSTAGVCELPQETACTTSASCATTQVCVTAPGASGMVCRSSCQTTSQCLGGQTCVAQPGAVSGACLDAPTGGDGGIGDGGGGMDGMDGTGGMDGNGGRDGTVPGEGGQDTGVVTNMCPSAQTQFGNVAQGDTNPGFTSAVGVRTATELLLFSAYNGPSPAGFDAGVTDGGTANLIYLQAFDPMTAQPKGPASPLFVAQPSSMVSGQTTSPLFILSATVAPTGQIVLTYDYGSNGPGSGSFNYNGGENNYGLFGAFLAPSGDAGTSYQLAQTLLLETAPVYGQPHGIWSVTAKAFVLSWEYIAGGGAYLKVKKFLPTGAQASGDTDTVPTDEVPADNASGSAFEQGSAGSYGGLTGIAFVSSPQQAGYLTVLDPVGNIVGLPVPVFLTATIGSFQNPGFVTVGATAGGFVYVSDYTTAAVGVTYLPASGDAGVALVDGGVGPTFTFPMRATEGHAINDDVGGLGGVGVALLYPDGLSFLYVNPDGMTHVGPDQAISHTTVAGDMINITNSGGSFGLSLYSAALNSAQIAATGCP